MAVELSRTLETLPRLISSTRPTTLVDPIDVFSAAAHVPHRALWLRPSSGEALVGVGSARTFGGDSIGTAWRELVAAADIEAPPDGGPVLIGGFGFDPASRASRLWDGFGGSRLVLPDQMLRIDGQSAWLTTNRVIEPRPLPRDAAKPSGLSRPGLAPADWRDLVGSIASGIRDGSLGVSKLVLARTEQIDVRASVESAVRRLVVDYPGCTIFALASGDACFVGATPERLVSLHDGTATTMALAGTFPRGASPEADARLAARLLADPKERTEHAVVVECMREDLAPVCRRVIADAEPHIHALASVQHLITPIRAQVRAGASVLDLVERLHPTPAVGGYPRQRALELIREHEALDRGWYAAPLGWVDARGEGDFVVGLRSALLRGGTATLFAGCGIVGGSDPETEYVESGWKLRPMLGALGAEV
jgi:isochorismate synthase